MHYTCYSLLDQQGVFTIESSREVKKKKEEKNIIFLKILKHKKKQPSAYFENASNELNCTGISKPSTGMMSVHPSRGAPLFLV